MFARSVARAAPRSSALPSAATRSYRTIPGPMACLNARPQLEKKSVAPQQIRAASEHAIANPTLAGIEKRWEGMPPQEQAELWMQLRDRMKVDWHQMTLQEKKAAYWIAFGAHGPRAGAPKGEGLRILIKVTQLTAVSFAIFYVIHLFAKPQPKTMSKEWQEASNEYALREKMDPMTGISSKEYQGKGFVQSPPLEKS
ncbi:cytochrome c oxidase subunit IV family protein [Aspergillus candidus]|uniref:Cytochrome c oxidase polypeptide V n=1 Tax=Aspergillus candidus TaxID=41067 RepID=A0A2I2F210_ASPCN|nr:cytochrome c oxidase, subunit IV/COX5b [Aspergillus candidus]PLB34661.1 cytochrome c oxidase, subunit IV/COX5b [Aspergillus candidus]